MKLIKTTAAALIASLCVASSVHAADDALTVVKNYMSAWSALAGKKHVSDQDVAKAANIAASFLDGDVEYLDSTVGTPQVGIVVARDNVIRAFLSSFRDAKWEMVGEPKVTGNDVEYKWKFTGHANGPYIMDPTCKGKGEAINLPGESKITVKDGLITYQNDKYDEKVLPSQLTKSDLACKKQHEAEAKAAAKAAAEAEKKAAAEAAKAAKAEAKKAG